MTTKLRKLVDLAHKHHAKLGILGYIVGMVWFVALIHPKLNNETYFSENALLPGMVDTHYEHGSAAKSLKAEVENPSEAYRDNFPLWLMDKMTAIGLESYQQNFSVQFPKELSIMHEPINGTNIYGILRAPRVAGTEVLVFLIPLKRNGPFYELVLLLSLAEHFRNNVYWAKDVIFLVVDQKEIGIQSWLDEYHGIQSTYVRSSRMLGRSGAIQAAINLDLEGKDISYMQVMVESLNGQLPNLDLVNMVSKLCLGRGIPIALTKLPMQHSHDGLDQYRSSLSTMLSMMFNQASGRPSANHGLFPKYGIEAVTLRGRKETGAGSVSFGRIGRALEGMFRSLNSLLERFHQSFFFYLLSSTSRYVSIGLYMPPLGCLMIGPVLAAVSCWVRSVEDKGLMKDDDQDSTEKSGDKSENDETQKDERTEEEIADTSEKDEQKSSKDSKLEEFAFTRVPRHFGKVLRVILAGHFVGLSIYLSPCLLRYIEVSGFDLEPSSFLLFLLFGIFLLGLNLPLISRVTSCLDEKDVLLLKSIALVIHTCQVGCLATINFSFGFFLALFTIPSFLFVHSTQNRLRRLIQVVLVFLSSPPCILFLMTVLYSYFSSESQKYDDLLRDSFTLYADSILSSLRDSVLIGTWSYPVTMLVILPNWLLFWFIAWF